MKRIREFCRACGEVSYCDWDGSWREEDNSGFFKSRFHWVYPELSPFEEEVRGVKCGDYIPYTWWNRLVFFLTTKLIRLICGDNYARPETR